jgi:hypothetical protein
MKKNYELTVSICVYNTKYLKRLLISLKKQTFRNVLYSFIVDNPIKSREIVITIKKYKLNCEIHINNKNIGSYKSYDLSLKKSNTNFFLRVDDDDYFLNANYLSIMMSTIKKGYDFVIPNVYVIYSNNEIIRNQNIIFKSCINKSNFIKAFFKESSTVFYSIFKRKKLLSLSRKYLRTDLVVCGEGILNLKVVSNLKGTFSPLAIYCYFRHNNHNSDNIKKYLVYESFMKYLFAEILNLINIKHVSIFFKTKKIIYNLILITIQIIKITKHKIIKV